MSLPRYPKYKDSGVEWLGQVPEGWGVAKIKRVASIRYGIGEPPKYYDAGIPLIRATNIRAGQLYSEGMVFVDPIEIPEQRIVWLAEGDIIVVRSGAYTGDSAIIPRGFGRSIAGFDMVLKCHSVLPDFIQYALLSKYLKEGQIDLERMRAAQPHLNAEELGACLVALPNVQDQHLITTFLDRETAKIDALVSEQEKLITLLKEKRQAVISHAVTKGLDPTVPMKDSGVEWLGKVPEGWTMESIKNLARDGQDTFTDGDWVELPHIAETGVRLIQTGNVGIGVYKEQGFKFISEKSFATLGCTEIKPNDVLICRLDGPVGRGCLVPDLGCKMITSVDNTILKTKESVLPNFIVYLFSSAPWLSWIDALCRVGGGFRLRISRTMLGNFAIALPPLHEQHSICNHLDHTTSQLDTLITEAQRVIELLKERRSALISAAVTGQIDVRGLVA